MGPLRVGPPGLLPASAPAPHPQPPPLALVGRGEADAPALLVPFPGGGRLGQAADVVVLVELVHVQAVPVHHGPQLVGVRGHVELALRVRPAVALFVRRQAVGLQHEGRGQVGPRRLEHPVAHVLQRLGPQLQRLLAQGLAPDVGDGGGGLDQPLQVGFHRVLHSSGTFLRRVLGDSG